MTPSWIEPRENGGDIPFNPCILYIIYTQLDLYGPHLVITFATTRWFLVVFKRG